MLKNLKLDIFLYFSVTLAVYLIYLFTDALTIKEIIKKKEEKLYMVLVCFFKNVCVFVFLPILL